MKHKVITLNEQSNHKVITLNLFSFSLFISIIHFDNLNETPKSGSKHTVNY
jgi:hypothetical protein